VEGTEGLEGKAKDDLKTIGRMGKRKTIGRMEKRSEGWENEKRSEGL
jgi:hypothetical protein